MKRYKSKVERKYGQNLQVKGERSLSAKAAFRRRAYPPGAAGKKKFRLKLSEYGKQLAEKQKLRISYGLKERQFRNIVQKAINSGKRADIVLMELLERRLDNVILRSGMAESRGQARQIVTHAHVLVNGRCVDVPSYQVKKGDVIGFKKRLRESKQFANIETRLKNFKPPLWLDLDRKKLEIKVVKMPEDKDLETAIDLPQVVEFYSR